MPPRSGPTWLPRGSTTTGRLRARSFSLDRHEYVVYCSHPLDNCYCQPQVQGLERKGWSRRCGGDDTGCFHCPSVLMNRIKVLIVLFNVRCTPLPLLIVQIELNTIYLHMFTPRSGDSNDHCAAHTQLALLQFRSNRYAKRSTIFMIVSHWVIQALAFESMQNELLVSLNSLFQVRDGKVFMVRVCY